MKARTLLIPVRALLAGAAIVLAYQQLPALFGAWETSAPLQWWAARTTGLLAYVALTASMIFGLMISSRGLDGAVGRKTVLEHHQQWTLVAVVATVVHMLVIVTDEYVPISVAGTLVPGASAHLTGPVALGTIAFWGIAVLALSSWLRGHMSFTAWRVLHAGALGAFGLGLVHGWTAGTDTELPPVQLLYAATAALVFAGTTFRLLHVARSRASTRAAGARPPAAPAAAVAPVTPAAAPPAARPAPAEGRASVAAAQRAPAPPAAAPSGTEG